MPQSDKGYTNGSYHSTLKPLHTEWDESNPSNHECLGLIQHFWYNMRESPGQRVGERQSQERGSKSPHRMKEFGMFVELSEF